MVEHALEGELDRLKERVIGSALYGRQPDYDTGTDSIVRVTAAEVRKRLDIYNERTAGTEPVVIELPTGSYIPEIHLEMADRHSAPTAEVAAKVIGPKAAVGRRLLVAATTGWLAAILIGLMWAGSEWLLPGAEQRALRYLPWTALLNGGPPPHMIVADASMGVLRYVDWFPLSLPIYANRGFLLRPPELSPEARAMWDQMAPKAYTSIVDARMAAGYAALATTAGRKPVIQFARDLRLSDFHLGENLILLGSPSSNPWVELFENQLDFHLHLDDRTRGVTVTVGHPKPGDPALLTSTVSSGRTGEAYATLALVHGLDGRGSVLIAQGTIMEGTDVAGSLAITRPEELAGELRRCGLDPTKATGEFEILLRLDATAGSARTSSIIATRCRPSQ
ncbi:MAG: hypothetical protein NTY38_08110 [Acidobacteria bacterium]|nr:hypothetical protein [Acidobacteriota bacterium]